ncbi:MAG: hypothetical protein PHD37_17360 [Gallionellaceae bacterium]|nr:hypothetical protein [Gallionellaceae bacterium]
MKSDKWAERLRAGFNLSAAEMFDLSSDLAILEAECREREKAAFLAGVAWPIGTGLYPRLMKKAEAEAARRYGDGRGT